MMKQPLLIITMVSVYILFGSKGCVEDDQSPAYQEQKRIEKAADSIAGVFSSDDPSAISLLAFEETAKMRFSDFLDYLQIISDSSVGPTFSKHAGQMITEQFVSDSLTLRFINRETILETEISIGDLVADESTFHARLGVVHPDSVWLLHDIQRINETTFLGVLGYRSDVITPSTDCTNYFPVEGSIVFFATKRAKSFGHDTLSVWTVLLGENEVFQE